MEDLSRFLIYNGMKKWIFILISLFVVQGVLSIKDRAALTVNDLSPKTRLFIEQHFPYTEVFHVHSKRNFWDRIYNVVFTNGDRLEFNKAGSWAEITSKEGALSKSVIPHAIQYYVAGNYPGNEIVELKWDKRFYKIELANGLELTFNKAFQRV